MHCLNIYILYISEWFPNNLSFVQAFKGTLLSIVSNYRFDKLKDAFAGIEAQQCMETSNVIWLQMAKMKMDSNSKKSC